ncbi:MAG: hypothetical protein PHW82_01955 [Bacteroidales bacterium]|nr:hypothetical protein [Bacteroidales bacterium]
MEVRPNMIKKYNKPFYGLLGGIILPVITFLIYYAYSAFSIEAELPLLDFIQTIYNKGAFTPVLSLCVLPNLILFFIFKKTDYWYAMKGLILSVLIYTILVLIIKFM